jgi:hypothetical protein
LRKKLVTRCKKKERKNNLKKKEVCWEEECES